MVNRELIRRDFRFITPKFNLAPSNPPIEDSPDDVEDEKIEETAMENKTLADYLREDLPEEEPQIVDADAENWAIEVEHVRDRFGEEEKSDTGNYMFRIRRMNKYLIKLKSLATNTGNQAIQNFIYACEKALNSIELSERRLNKDINQKSLSEMTEVREVKIEKAHELINLRNKVKDQIDLFDNLSDKCSEILVNTLILHRPN